MRRFIHGYFLALGLMLAVTGCSPWQKLSMNEYLQGPELIGQGGPIRVTTIYGDTYEGKGMKESNRERLVMELVEPGSNSKLSGMILSIPKDKIKEISQWVTIY
jgi:hypothetical protein